MVNKHRYEVILYWSADDQAFIAEVPELPGCAADGASYQEALAAVEVVIEEWIETAKELEGTFQNRVGVYFMLDENELSSSARLNHA